jgi:hypothetical protein
MKVIPRCLTMGNCSCFSANKAIVVDDRIIVQYLEDVVKHRPLRPTLMSFSSEATAVTNSSSPY